MKSSNYSIFCHKILKKFILKKYNNKILKDLNLKLEKANISMIASEYLSQTYITTLLSIPLILFFTLTLYILVPGMITLLIVPIMSISIPFIIWQFFNFLPTIQISKRKMSIDRFLPYAVNFINTMAVAGIYPVQIFRNLALIDAYGELQVEAKKIVRRIDDMGMDNISALKYAIDVSPSKRFKSFLQGIIGTIQSGSDLNTYLSNIVEKYLDDEFVERKKNLELLGVVAEIFVISIVAFPLFLVIIISIMSFLVGPPNFTIDTLFLFAFLILPLAYLGFYILIRSVSYEEISRYKNMSFLTHIKSLYSDNKQLWYLTLVTFFTLFGFIVGTVGLHISGIMNLGDYFYYDIGFISSLILIGPFGFYLAKIASKRKEIQDRLTDLFVELGNSVSSGVSVFDAVRIASKGNYGELTPEINKMKAELSWRLSITKVFNNFVERMKSGIIYRIFITITKGLTMGGESEKVFQAAAKELTQVTRIEEQKKANMSIYTVVILMSFFVFLAIIIILDRTLFSTFFETATLNSSQPVNINNAALRISYIDPELFKYSLYSFVFIQGFGTGILGGYMMDGRLSSGIRYSFVLGLVSILVFKLLF